MSSRWSPHPRFRIYTRTVSYCLPLRTVLPESFDRGETIAQFETEVCRRFDVSAMLGAAACWFRMMLT